ncbi:hypothetical protein DFH09DRAFT_1360443 [Mycena vulgaris]|nr:hypothetical protein DFH09DRAFT_1360443 [Mycena vulgaris]
MNIMGHLNKSAVRTTGTKEARKANIPIRTRSQNMTSTAQFTPIAFAHALTPTPTPVVPGGQVARAFVVVTAKHGAFTDFPPQHAPDADEALVHTYASFREEPAIALSPNTSRDDTWTLCVAVPIPEIPDPTLLSVDYMIHYATIANEGNATIQTDLLLTTASLPAAVVSGRAALDVYRPTAGAPRMVDRAAALCLATTLAIKANGGGEQWSHYVDTQHVTPDVRVHEAAQLYVVFNVQEHSTLRTARSLSVDVSATWQREEVEQKALAEEERKMKEAAEKEARELEEKRARDAKQDRVWDEEREWREEESQARVDEEQAREEALSWMKAESARRQKEWDEEREWRDKERNARVAEKQAREEALAWMRAESAHREEERAAAARARRAALPASADQRTKEAIERLKHLADPGGSCSSGYEWLKTETGYKCAGGAHSLTFAQLGME